MTVTGNPPATDAEADARIAHIEQRPDAPESWAATIERMARAIWDADCGHSVEELSGATPEPYVRLAAAALRVVTERTDGAL